MIFKTLKIMRLPFDGNDIHGQPLTAKPIPEWVAPVKVALDNQHTTVRTDSAASHGHGYETTADVILLLDRKSKIALEDILLVNGTKVKVIQHRPQYRVNGELDHYQIHCIAWK